MLTRERLEAVLEALDPDSLNAPRRALEEFARRLLARASLEFFEARTTERIVQDVQELYRFVEETPPAEVGARVTRVEDRAHRGVVSTVLPDCPFIVDTLREHLHAEGFGMVHLLHPVVVLDRDRGGKIAHVRERTAEGARTSITYIVIDGHLSDEAAAALEKEIAERLGMVRTATSDFAAMLERCSEIVGDLEEDKRRLSWRASEFEEIQELLNWLQDGHFVFLGYRTYELFEDEAGERRIQAQPDSSLGILRDVDRSRYHEPTRLKDMPADLRARILGGPLLIVSKTNALSPVHRRARMDDISIKKIGPNGEVESERRFLGLFTAKAFAEDASNIPILRRKLREILEAERADKGSHDYGLIVRIFNSLPKEEVFLTSVAELIRVIDSVMEAEASGEVLTFARPDPLGRGVNVIVIMPKHRFSGEVREKIQQTLVEEYRGSVLNYHLALGEGDQARLHFYLSSELEEIDSVNIKAVEAKVRESVRTWEERLTDVLERRHGVEAAHELSDRHRGDFTPEYMAAVDVETAADDIAQLELLDATGLQQVALEELDPPRPNGALLKVFAPQGLLVLSDVMPILENLGYRVIESEKYDVGRPGSERASTVHTFLVETPPAWEVDRADAEARVAAAFRAVRGGEAENDRLNSLVLSARLEWREVALLRAYAGYAFRIGAVRSRLGVQRPLTEYPRSARLLFEIFRALHDPAEVEGRGGRAAELIAEFHESLEAVRGIEDDRTYRRLLNLVQATVRTNYFQQRARRRPGAMISLKFDCERIEVMPRPRPRFEVYVRSPTTEGAHLRMDAVARGGIRWSDRREDFRVEVLGLVKTQQVKNAVIVPAGAKGAFVARRLPTGDEERQAAGVASYEQFIRGLLDMTDSVRAGRVVHPPETVIRDVDDPYLVVAADKGTAHLSDKANELAAEYGLWLGDAFASGGSQGYDHKQLGITARGAWESVKRHFRELGINVQEEEFTVVGVGDMSGDVFGNAMLLSRKIRLVGAFDHRHIFLDPDPDPEASWRERKRLYELPGSTWADYDPAALSEGGGVYERGAKRITLSPQARARLGVEEETLNGDALIRALLCARVDLLWSGGIGTYVKASTETQGEVGDPSNDAVRIDASELGARVVGEGGNLGLSQRARVEYALRGGRLNTDALDNSAGVDMSDHEVNLKILFGAAVEDGELTTADRNALLRELSAEVSWAVLTNTYWQSLAVSLDEHRVRRSPAEFRDALSILERAGVLDRQLEHLPTTEELLERREEEGRFLTRPELAILLAYAKMHLKRSLRASDIPEDPALFELLRQYFPSAAIEAVTEERLRSHRLRSGIVSTMLTNLVVDRMGGAGHIQLARETGRSAAEVARAWYVAYRLAGAERLYARVAGLDYVVPAGVQMQAMLGLSDSLGRGAHWLLTNTDPTWTIERTVEWYEAPVGELREALPRVLTERGRSDLENRIAMLDMDGVDEETASGLAAAEYLDGLLPIARLARERELPAPVVGEVFYGLTDVVDFPWLQEQLGRAPGADLWEQRAAKTLSFQLEAARGRMAAGILRRVSSAEEVRRSMHEFQSRFSTELGRIRQLLDDLRAMERPELSALMVAVHAVGDGSLTGADAEK